MKPIKITFSLLFLMSVYSASLFGQSVIVEDTKEKAELKARVEAERARDEKRLKSWTFVAPQPRHSSELSFSKRFDNESLDAEKSFIINKSSKSVSLSLSGEALKGTIKLTLISPDGDDYQILEIDNSSDLRWRQSFSIEEEKDDDLIGKWKIKIKAEEATGSYMFRMISH